MTADRVAAWATGIGIGFAVFIVTWIIMNRLTGMWMPVPQGPVVTLISAMAAGSWVGVERGRTLSRRVQSTHELADATTQRRAPGLDWGLFNKAHNSVGSLSATAARSF